jgi:hypothetical protein
VKEGSGMGVCFHWGPVLGDMEGRFFHREIFYKESETCKKGPCKGAVLSIGALLGNLEGCFTGMFEKKRKGNPWVPLSWTLRTLKVKSEGHLEL